LLKPDIDFPLENLILAESTQFRTSQLTRSGGTLPLIFGDPRFKRQTFVYLKKV
jgi:hypothetical protein